MIIYIDLSLNGAIREFADSQTGRCVWIENSQLDKLLFFNVARVWYFRIQTGEVDFGVIKVILVAFDYVASRSFLIGSHILYRGSDLRLQNDKSVGLEAKRGTWQLGQHLLVCKFVNSTARARAVKLLQKRW